MEQLKPQAIFDEEEKHAKNVQRIFWLRISLFFILTAFAAVLGAVSFVYLRYFETANLHLQIQGSVTQLEDTIRNGLGNKVTSSRLLGNIYKYALQENGDDGTFPEAILPGFATIAKDLLTLGTYKQLYWLPLINNATNLMKFETWAKKNIKNFGSNVTSTIQTINQTLFTYGVYYKPDPSSTSKYVLPIPRANPRYDSPTSYQS